MIDRYFSDYYLIENKEYNLCFNRADSMEFNLLVNNCPSVPQLKEDIEEVNVDGRSGSLIIKNGTYQDRKLSINFKLLDVENIWEQMEEITDWLLNVKSNKLYYDRDDYYYKVKKVEIGDLKKEVQKHGEFKVDFICEPFLYSDTVYKKVYFADGETSKTFKVTNNGHFDVEPIIEIETDSNTNIVLEINSENITINNVNGKLIIDSNLMLCYIGTTNKLPDMFGNFPMLNIGENNIIIRSQNRNIKKITISYEQKYR